MGITFQKDYKIDVDSLFGFKPEPVKPVEPTVADIANGRIQKAYTLLSSADGPQKNTSYSSYIRDRIAAREDMAGALRVLNQVGGDSKEIAQKIAQLDNPFVTSTQALKDVPKIMGGIQRHALVSTANTFREMRDKVKSGLWESSTQTERELIAQFDTIISEMDAAIALFDKGDTEGASAKYTSTMSANKEYVNWFGRAYRQSEEGKFGAKVGAITVASFASGFIGGAVAGPILAGGRAASMGWRIFAASSATVASGVSFTMANRAMDMAVFKTPFLRKDTTVENIKDLTAESAHNTLLFGWMHGIGAVAKALPQFAGEMAAAANWTKSFATEFSGLTAFNAASAYTARVNDPTLPSPAQVVSKEAIAESVAFLLGLKAAGATVGGAIKTVQHGYSKLGEFFNSPMGTFIKLAPLSMFIGIPGGGIGGKSGVPSTPTGSAVDPLPLARALQGALALFETKVGSHATKFSEIYHTRPHKFWTVLALITMGIPEAWVAAKILKYEPDEHTDKIMSDFASAKMDNAIREVVDYVIKNGVTTYLTNVGKMTDEIESRSVQMDRAIRGARYMLDTIANFGKAATAAGQTLGLEVEYLYRNALGQTALKDPIYEALQAALEKSGNAIELQTGATSFVFPDKPSFFPILRGKYTYNGQTIRYEILTGTGAIIVSAIPEWAEERATTLHAKGCKDVFEARTDMRQEVARQFNIPVRDIQALEGNPETHVESDMIMVKAKDNDILKMFVDVDKQLGVATLTMMNGVFGDGSKVFTVPAKSLHDVIKHVKETLPGQAFANKVDTYSALKLTTPEGRTHVLTLTDEADPFSEFVSSILRHKDFHLMDTVLNTLKAMGAKGTSAARLVGIHIHMGIPMKDPANGRYTIAPVLGVLREYVRHARDLLAILPSNPNRQGFIQPISPKLAKRLMDPNYVKDPTDLPTVLRVMADIAGILSKKYSALNLDNHVALMIQEMIEDGTIKDGQVINAQWKKETYRFRVIAGESQESYNIIREFDNGRPPVHLMRIASPQVRKPTAELRVFDTVVDAPTVNFWLQFIEAWGWRHGTDIMTNTQTPPTTH